MTTPFSAPDEAILTATVELSQLMLSSTSSARQIPVYELYDIGWVTKQIIRGGFRRIALQFPDELLCDSSSVFWSLQADLVKEIEDENEQRELFVLADTSYGNCCVDEVAADHIDADLVIHFGHACLSLTSRLPVIYVFHKLPIDPHDAAKKLAARLEDDESRKQKSAVLMYDVGYEHACEEVCVKIQSIIGRPVKCSHLEKGLNFDRYLSEGTEGRKATVHADTDISSALASPCHNSLPEGHTTEDTVVLYLGPESLALTNMVLRLGPGAEVVSYDAVMQNTRIETGTTNKLLQRRYVAVQRARDAQTVALLIGTLGIRNYLPLLSTLREHLTKVQKKKVYTISVGKLNPAKLANFQEIDVFVLIACPENSLVEAKEAQRSKEFFRPIVTPFELMMAFKGREWTGQYILDLETVLDDVQQENKEETKGEASADVDEPHFSLLTGGLVSSARIHKLDGDETNNKDVGDGVVMLRESNGALTRVMDSAGGQYIASRSWRGLEPRLGMDEAAPLEIGRSGIAKVYVAGPEAEKEGQ